MLIKIVFCWWGTFANWIHRQWIFYFVFIGGRPKSDWLGRVRGHVYISKIITFPWSFRLYKRAIIPSQWSKNLEIFFKITIQRLERENNHLAADREEAETQQAELTKRVRPFIFWLALSSINFWHISGVNTIILKLES